MQALESGRTFASFPLILAGYIHVKIAMLNQIKKISKNIFTYFFYLKLFYLYLN